MSGCTGLRDFGVIVVLATVLDSQRNIDLRLSELVVLLEHIVVTIPKYGINTLSTDE